MSDDRYSKEQKAIDEAAKRRPKQTNPAPRKDRGKWVTADEFEAFLKKLKQKG